MGPVYATTSHPSTGKDEKEGDLLPTLVVVLWGGRGRVASRDRPGCSGPGGSAECPWRHASVGICRGRPNSRKCPDGEQDQVQMLKANPCGKLSCRPQRNGPRAQLPAHFLACLSPFGAANEPQGAPAYPVRRPFGFLAQRGTGGLSSGTCAGLAASKGHQPDRISPLRLKEAAGESERALLDRFAGDGFPGGAGTSRILFAGVMRRR